MKRIILILSLIVCSSLYTGHSLCAQTLQSPDGRFTMQFALNDKGRPSYRLTLDGKEVIGKSGLGLELKKEQATLPLPISSTTLGPVLLPANTNTSRVSNKKTSATI